MATTTELDVQIRLLSSQELSARLLNLEAYTRRNLPLVLQPVADLAGGPGGGPGSHALLFGGSTGSGIERLAAAGLGPQPAVRSFPGQLALLEHGRRFGRRPGGGRCLDRSGRGPGRRTGRALPGTASRGTAGASRSVGSAYGKGSHAPAVAWAGVAIVGPTQREGPQSGPERPEERLAGDVGRPRAIARFL